MRPDWVPEDFDIERPSAARVYDYMLGGCNNFEVDRRFAEEFLKLMPEARAAAMANRAFLHRAVRFLVGAGIRQFIDIGSGIPTVGNVHEVAQQAAPDARVVYVDIDPVAVAHCELMLEDNDNATVFEGDLRDPEALLGSPELHRLLDLRQPVALLLVGMLHLLSDEDDPAGIIGRLRDAMAPGSYLVITAGLDESDTVPVDQIRDLAARRKMLQTTWRPRTQVLGFFTGFTLVEPGLVHLSQWRPDSEEDAEDDLARIPVFAGVGHKD